MSNKKVLAHWREFNKVAKQKNISPELKRAIERADNIRINYIKSTTGE